MQKRLGRRIAGDDPEPGDLPFLFCHTLRSIGRCSWRECNALQIGVDFLRVNNRYLPRGR